MKRIRFLEGNIYAITMIAIFAVLTGYQVQESGNLTAVPFTDVAVADEFRAPGLERNSKVTVAYVF